MAGLTVV